MNRKYTPIGMIIQTAKAQDGKAWVSSQKDHHYLEMARTLGSDVQSGSAGAKALRVKIHGLP